MSKLRLLADVLPAVLVSMACAVGALLCGLGAWALAIQVLPGMTWNWSLPTGLFISIFGAVVNIGLVGSLAVLSFTFAYGTFAIWADRP